MISFIKGGRIEAGAVPSSSAARTVPPYAWYVVFILSVVNAVSFMDRMVLSILLPGIKADLGLSDTQSGLLVGLGFSLFYALCGVPLARLADRRSRRNLITISLALWSVMTALSGSAQNFWHLLLARIGVGAGEAGGLAPSQSVICDYVPLKNRIGAFAIHNIGAIVGATLGIMLAGWLATAYGWRLTFVIIGLPGLVLAAILWLTVRDPVRGALDPSAPSSGPQSIVAIFWELWACRTYRYLLVVQTAAAFAQHGLTQWLPTYYTRVVGLSLSATGFNLGMALGIASTAGLVVGAFVSERLARIDTRLALSVSAMIFIIPVPLLAICLLSETALVSFTMFALAQFMWSVGSGPTIAVLYSVARAEIRATAGSITILFSSVLGIGMGPFAVGVLSDLATPSLGNLSLRYALFAPVAALLLVAVALKLASRHVVHDLRLDK